MITNLQELITNIGLRGESSTWMNLILSAAYTPRELAWLMGLALFVSMLPDRYYSVDRAVEEVMTKLKALDNDVTIEVAMADHVRLWDRSPSPRVRQWGRSPSPPRRPGHLRTRFPTPPLTGVPAGMKQKREKFERLERERLAARPSSTERRSSPWPVSPRGERRSRTAPNRLVNAGRSKDEDNSEGPLDLIINQLIINQLNDDKPDGMPEGDRIIPRGSCKPADKQGGRHGLETLQVISGRDLITQQDKVIGYARL